MLTEAQLAFRRQGLGGSDIASLVRGDVLNLWLDKKGRSDFAGNRFTEWGNRLESAVLAKFEDEHDCKLAHPRDVWPDSVDGTIQHPEHPLVIATPDGVRLAACAPAPLVVPHVTHLVQAKCVGTFAARAYGELPDDKVAQCIWELFAVRGRQAAQGIPDDQLVSTSSLVALVGGNDWREYDIAWDAELAGMLLDAAREFWDTYVAPDVQPPIDGSELASEYLKRKFPRNSGKMLPAPAGSLALVREYSAASAEEKAAKERKETAGNALRALIGDADGIDGVGFKATWKTQSAAPNYRLVAESLGASKELIAKHTASHRVLRVMTRDE